MSFLDINPTEAQELEAVEAGEYELTILSAELKDSAKQPGKQMIELAFKIEGGPVNAKTLREWLHIPTADDDEGKKNSKLLRIKNFCECFDYDPSNGLETEDLIGLSGKCILGVESSDEYGDQNRIRRFLS